MFSLIFGGEIIFADRWKMAKIVKIKNSCHTVSLVYLNFFCFVDSLSLYFRKTKKNRPVRRRKDSAHLKFSFIACNTIELYWVWAAHRVKLSKLNQTGSIWTEFLREENGFLFCYQYYFYTLRTNRMKMKSFNFFNYHRMDVCTQARVINYSRPIASDTSSISF